MDAVLRNFLLGTLILIISIFFLKIRYDSFENPTATEELNDSIKNVHNSVPAVDPKVVQSTITGIKDMIIQRPDTILVIKQVLADPLINKTLYDILNTLKPGNRM